MSTGCRCSASATSCSGLCRSTTSSSMRRSLPPAIRCESASWRSSPRWGAIKRAATRESGRLTSSSCLRLDAKCGFAGRPSRRAMADTIYATMVGAMRIFHCDHCDHLVFFENHSCVSCGRQLAFLPDIAEIGSLDPGTGDLGLAARRGLAVRLLAVRELHHAQRLQLGDPGRRSSPLCSSCRLTPAIPDRRSSGSARPGTSSRLPSGASSTACCSWVAGRRPRRRSRPRTRVRVPGGPAAGQRPRVDRAPWRRHHHQPRRG